MFFLTKTAFLERFPKRKTAKILKKSTFFKNTPLATDPGTTRGGILNKGRKKFRLRRQKTLIFGRFSVFLISVKVFKIFVFSSVTTLSKLTILVL